MIDPDLPDELNRDSAATPESEGFDREEQLAVLGEAVAKLRDEAVLARRDSGIEAAWMAAEEAYLCIDDMNRHEFEKAKWAKPMAMQGPITTESSKGSGDGRSTVFVRLTARYVDMGAAKIAEIVLPIDGKPFAFKPTPVPEPVIPVDPAQPATPPMPMAPVPGAMGMQPQAPVAATIDPYGKQLNPAEKAEKRIYDWMVESKYKGEMRKVIHDAARIGVGVLKGPFPCTKKKRAVTIEAGPDGKKHVRIDMIQKIVPGYKWVDPWNFYPHGACGENIHAGDYVVEHDSITRATLQGLKEDKDIDGKPIYLTSQIDRVLEEGPDGHKEDSGKPHQRVNKGNFNIWYFTGVLSKKDMMLTNAVGIEDLPEEMNQVHAVVTLINNSVIRATINPIENGSFGYNPMPWSRRAGSWAGVGVAEQVSVPQKIVNNGSRAVFNNAGVSAGVQLVIDPIGLQPANGSKLITPNKLWERTADATTDDVRKLMAAIEIPNITAQLMPIIQYGMKLAEECSNIPLISQGHDGETPIQTFGQAQLQNHNANTLLRDLAETIDDNVTEPVVQNSYDWLLADPEVPTDEKGDFDIDCRGSSSLVENAIQEQTLMAIGGMVVNPAFGMDTEKWAEMMLKSKRIDPEKLKMDDAKKQQMAQNQQPAPAIQAAQINSKARIDAANIMAGVTMQRIKVDTDRDTAYVNAEAQKNANDHQMRMSELTVKRELAMLEYAQQNKTTLENVKAQLAQTAMKLNTQKELSMAALNVDVHKHHNQGQVMTPPVEVAGRAPDGQGFEL